MHHPDELLFNMTKYGFEEMLGKEYPNNMIVYEDVLSDGELLAVLGYIKSTWPERIKAIHNEINQSYASNKIHNDTMLETDKKLVFHAFHKCICEHRPYPFFLLNLKHYLLTKSP